jgi:hypothetical protein
MKSRVCIILFPDTPFTDSSLSGCPWRFNMMIVLLFCEQICQLLRPVMSSTYQFEYVITYAKIFRV